MVTTQNSNTMKHFLFIESIGDKAPFPYLVAAENLVEAIYLLAEVYIDPDVVALEVQDIDSRVYSKEELLIIGLKGYIHYFTAYRVFGIKPDSPYSWSYNITKDFSDTFLTLYGKSL